MAPAGAAQGPGPALGQPHPDPPGVLELVISRLADGPVLGAGMLGAIRYKRPAICSFPCSNRAAAAASCASLGSGAALTGAWACSAHASSTARTSSHAARARPSRPLTSAPERPLRRSRGLCRGPLHYADHHGDLIVLVDSDLGMGVVWGTEGAQECQVLLKLGQGRAVSKGLLDLACILVLGSHGHHLRGIERVRERGPPDPRARRRAMRVGTSCTPAAAH